MADKASQDWNSLPALTQKKVKGNKIKEQALREKLRSAITQPDWEGIVRYTNETGNFNRINETEDKVIDKILILIFEFLLAHKEYQRKWKDGLQILFGFSPDELNALRGMKNAK